MWKKGSNTFQGSRSPVLLHSVMAAALESFSCLLPGQIWKAVPAQDDRWVLEWRNADTRSVGFYVISPVTTQEQEVIVSEKETDWWMSLAGVGKETFFVHSYRNPDIPEPTDLLGYDLSAGTVKWVIPSGQFIGISDGQAVVALKSGADTTLYFCGENDGKLGDVAPEEWPESPLPWQEAQIYRENNPYYGNLSGFLFNSLGVKPKGSIEYLDYGDRMAFSYYLYEANRLVQYVAVVNRLKDIEFNERIEADLEKEGRSTFLEKNGWLFFIKEKRNFIGINLAV